LGEKERKNVDFDNKNGFLGIISKYFILLEALREGIH